MRVYNLEGRRDNKFKARVKILVHEIGDGRVPPPRRGRNSRRSTARASMPIPRR